MEMAATVEIDRVDQQPQAAGIRTINGLAVASLVCSIVWLCGVGSLLGVIFGAVARRQIAKSPKTQRGDGLAIAGVVVGLAGLIGSAVGYIVIAQYPPISILGALDQAFGTKWVPLATTIPVSQSASPGIVSITVYSFTYPMVPSVPSYLQSFVSHSAGTAYGSADVRECAGLSGAPLGPDMFDLGLIVRPSKDFAPLSPEVVPFGANLEAFSSIPANSCVRGQALFLLRKGSTPTGVVYGLWGTSGHVVWSLEKAR